MKILHFSDTHLGFNDLDILNDQNINQREADFYDAFSQVVQNIQKLKPDYIIHTGDLFHRSSPSNRAISFALEQFKIINSLNIPFILIAGNHSTPRTSTSSPILKIFDNYENITSVYMQKYEKVEFDDVVFHCIPHMNDETQAINQIELCENSLEDDKKNIMMMHCSVGASYLMQEFGEWVYPKDKEYLFDKMDYVALGHWHGYSQAIKGKNVYYSGSLERTSFADKRNNKGYVVVSLEQDDFVIEFYPITIRSILEFEIDCEDFQKSVDDLVLDSIENAICEVTLKNLTALDSLDITNAQIESLFKGCLYVYIKREFKYSCNGEKIDDVHQLSLQEFFLEHLKDDANELEYQRLNLKVQELFKEYDEGNDDT